ncbi:MAG: hypothetical protein RJB58_1406 [Pseudomonadota bacterium]|jgi:hypothetical protein
MKRLIAVTDVIQPGLAVNAVQVFDQLWNKHRYQIYITSVAEHDRVTEDVNGRPSMWRAFGATPRVALTFSIPWSSSATHALKIMFNPVSYLDEAGAYADLNAAIGNIERETEYLKSRPPEEVHGWVFQMLLTAVCCIKHEGFSEEREWRGVYSPFFGSGRPSETSALEKSLKVIQGVPQTVYQIPLDVSVSAGLEDLDMVRCLRKIIIGPTSYPWVMYEAFVEALTDLKAPDPTSMVAVTSLPLRG